MSAEVIRKCRTICLPFEHSHYNRIVKDATQFREAINLMFKQYPNLFPEQMADGYLMKDRYISKKMGIVIRRITINGQAYSIRPSFAMPYLIGTVSEVENALFLRKFSVPFWALAHVFGHNAMYWYRAEQSIGRFSIVGTTVQDPSKLPVHVAADEKHSWLAGEKVFVATTVADGCILGASVALDAGQESLSQTYGQFKTEAQTVAPSYYPQTVNTDGWQATVNAWKTIFPSIVTILCFLHVFIKIRDGAKKKFKEAYEIIAPKLWDAYRAPNKRAFAQRIRRLREMCHKKQIPQFISDKIKKLYHNIACYKIAYDYPGCHRTSNMLDRLMQKMDRHLFNTRYFHGSLHAAQLSIRGWVLINNFAPSCPYTQHKHGGKLQSPAERINNFQYSSNWLENLLVCGSLKAGHGSSGPPQNP
jgi:hypothetical protein